ncbi:MAG: hypothetical protein KDJ77_14135 [Rhodobiaceae bacterium]|nr:hypothetical protein [Rhodobiaceae bacterium]
MPGTMNLRAKLAAVVFLAGAGLAAAGVEAVVSPTAAGDAAAVAKSQDRIVGGEESTSTVIRRADGRVSVVVQRPATLAFAHR